MEKMEEIYKLAKKITQIYTEKIVLDESFIDIAAGFADMPGTVVLMSGGELDSSQYHIIAAKPWFSFKSYQNNIYITINKRRLAFKANPFDSLETIIDVFSDSFKQYIKPEPEDGIYPGLFGYLSYDLKDSLENLPRTSVDDLYLPDISLFSPSILVVHNKKNNCTSLCVPEFSDPSGSDLNGNIDFFKKKLAEKPTEHFDFKGNIKGFSSNFNKNEYIETIKKIKEYIAAGDVYQVNISQRFEMDFQGNPFSLFKALYHNNPAPFFSFVNADNHYIVSTSPERFLKQTQSYVETRPIKGTRPRGKTALDDENLKKDLLSSKKDDAELSMIVDLLRNDIGKVCKEGSVEVSEHKRVEAYQNVYHLVSVVKGILAKGKTSVDLIKATFPGGSITGCPKIRAMEIIDELEPNRRHIYTGSIGYIGFNNTMDLSIAIRTATVYNNKILFSVGGGIVFDSDPADEYNETIHKGETLMNVFKGNKSIKKESRFVWINGKIKNIEEACIPVMDKGLLFGYGFFETIKADNGRPHFLKEHASRFNKAWKFLFNQKKPDITWDSIVKKVIEKNRLTNKTAAVKILATKGHTDIAPFTNTLFVSATEYIHRLQTKKEDGLNLATYPYPRMTPLAAHKTLNYLFYLLAGKWAEKTGADEALIINPDGSVSETNTANIIMIKEKNVILPVSSHVLPGVTQEKICEIMLKWGYKIEKQVLMAGDLFGSAEVLVSNSLMGAVPVISIDGKKTGQPSDLWLKINNSLTDN